EVDHQLVPAHHTSKLVEASLRQPAVFEQRAGNDHLRRALGEPLTSVLRRDAAAQLQSTRPSVERSNGGRFGTRTELDDVTAREAVPAIQLRVVSRRQLRDEILFGAACARANLTIQRVAQRSADDLLNLAVMQV